MCQKIFYVKLNWLAGSRLVLYEPLMLDRIDEAEEEQYLLEEEEKKHKKRKRKKKRCKSSPMNSSSDEVQVTEK